jgi:hypothetical protein
MMVRLVAALSAASLAWAVVAPTAAAAGGSSIASAPVVSYGQQEFGNTTTDGGPAFIAGEGGSSWWNLPVVTGDRVTIDLTGQTEGDGFVAGAYAIGTNDFNFAQTQPFVSSTQANTFEFVFTAPAKGTMPLNVYTPDSIGAYNFTASVRHKLVLRLFPKGTNRRSHQTRFAVTVRTPDGATIKNPVLRMHVQLLTPHAGWRSIQSSAVKSTFSVHWTQRQLGSPQKVRVQVLGSNYATATTRPVEVTAR